MNSKCKIEQFIVFTWNQWHSSLDFVILHWQLTMWILWKFTFTILREFREINGFTKNSTNSWFDEIVRQSTLRVNFSLFHYCGTSFEVDFHAKIREIELMCNFLFLVFHRKFVKSRFVYILSWSWIWVHEKIRESIYTTARSQTTFFEVVFTGKNREITNAYVPFFNFSWFWFHEKMKIITFF